MTELLLALLALAALTILLIRERARDRERQERDRLHTSQIDSLLDRVQAPAAAQLAAVQRTIDDRPPRSDEADDKQYGFDIRPADDLALVDLISRSE